MNTATITLSRAFFEQYLIRHMAENYGYHPTVIRRHLEDEKAYPATLRKMAVYAVEQLATFSHIDLQIKSARLSKYKVTVTVESNLTQQQLDKHIIEKAYRRESSVAVFANATDADKAMLGFLAWLVGRDYYVFSFSLFGEISKIMLEFVKNDKLNVQARYRGAVLAVPRDMLYGNRWNVIEYFEKAEKQGLIRLESPSSDNMEVDIITYH